METTENKRRNRGADTQTDQRHIQSEVLFYFFRFHNYNVIHTRCILRVKKSISFSSHSTYSKKYVIFDALSMASSLQDSLLQPWPLSVFAAAAIIRERHAPERDREKGKIYPNQYSDFLSPRNRHGVAAAAAAVVDVVAVDRYRDFSGCDLLFLRSFLLYGSPTTISPQSESHRNLQSSLMRRSGIITMLIKEKGVAYSHKKVTAEEQLTPKKLEETRC